MQELGNRDNVVWGARAWRWIGCAFVLGWPLGCSAPPDDGEATANQTAALESTDVRPASMNGGTARIQLWGPNGWQDCTGQVISRDSILTAAHCLYDAGLYANGFSSPIWVWVNITHQESNGIWQSFSGAEYVTGYVQQSYVTLAAAGDNKKRRYDVAVLQRSSNWSSVVSSDVTALVRTTYGQKPEWLYAYGHGYYDDTYCSQGGCNVYDDNQLRRGLLQNFAWYGGTGDYYYRTVKSDYGNADPHICQGDSGGPWKTTSLGGTSVSGVQYGVTSFGGGTNSEPECFEDYGQAVQVAYHISWIAERVADGNGSCSNTSHTIGPKLGSWEVLNVSTKTCW